VRPAHRGKCCRRAGAVHGISHTSGCCVEKLANHDRVNTTFIKHIEGCPSGLEWRRIIAFRNVLVHDYLGIDLERVWEIIQRDVPSFKRAIAAMLEQSS
jgi:uncharacterized protein YutE (UPF0331/DUF86 family)